MPQKMLVSQFVSYASILKGVIGQNIKLLFLATIFSSPRFIIESGWVTSLKTGFPFNGFLSISVRPVSFDTKSKVDIGDNVKNKPLRNVFFVSKHDY